MRIFLKLSPNTTTVPFNYQQSLVGAFHKWLGQNELHDNLSLYSLSWLGGAVKHKGGFEFPRGATFFISSPLQELHTKVVQGMFNDVYIRWGMQVKEVNMKMPPNFGQRHRFVVQSPVLIKRKFDDMKHAQYYYPSDPMSSTYLTETLQNKLKRFDISTDVNVAFDPTYQKVGIKKVNFHGIDIKASFCPVIVEGDPKAVQFAWQVGVGNSTGIGFGALR